MYLAVAVLAIILASGAFSDSSSDGPEYTQVGQDCVQYVGFASHLELNLIGIDHQEWRQAWYDAMYQCENLMQFTAAVMMNQWHPGFYYVDAVCTEWFPGDDDPFVRRMCEDFARLCAIPGEREVTHVCREHFDTGLPLVFYAEYERYGEDDQFGRRLYRELYDDLGISSIIQRSRLPNGE